MKDRTAPRQPLRSLRPSGETTPDSADTGTAATTIPNDTRSVAPTEGSTVRIRLDLIDDSPYQPRGTYDPEKIDELAKGLAANGQQEPVILREKPNGRYELIGGHRRKRAALSIGWAEIESRVKRYSDEEAERATLIQNEGREDLSDYERAKNFRLALKRGFAKNQVECAEMFSTSQTNVSRCLAMLDLPAPILDLLERQPDLFGHNTAVLIRDLIKQYPNEIDLITKGVERIRDGAEANSLRGWIAQMLAADSRSPANRSHSVIANASGAPMYETRLKHAQRQVLLSVKDTGEDLEAFNLWLIEALRKRSEAGE